MLLALVVFSGCLLFLDRRTLVFYGIVNVAKLSFLAWTRNLMMMVVFTLVCIVQHMKIRSLVLARDDASRTLCSFRGFILVLR